MFGHMTTAERVEAAKQKTERVVDHLFQLIALHENNAVVVYSDALALQIPRSYAANAFNVFQQSLYRFEIVRLCALWDRAWPDLSRETIPTIVELIADSNVIDALVEETRSTWSSGILPVDSEDPTTDAALRESLARLNERPIEEKAAEVSEGLKKSIALGRKIENSAILRNVRKLRDKHLASPLLQTFQEKETAEPMQYGDERELLLGSIDLVETLQLWVNGTSIDFDKSQQIARKSVEALWKHCTFDIARED
jgi:HEPN superfamily AbiU2-like protein